MNFELLLGYGIKKEAHTICLEPQHFLELIRWHGLKVVRTVPVGRTVQRASGFGDDPEMLLVADILGTLEHHVLEKMGESGLADFLSSRAHVVSDINMYEWVRFVAVQDNGQGRCPVQISCKE